MQMQDDITKIIRYLSFIQIQIHTFNKNGYFDLNKSMEIFSKHYLKLIYGYNLSLIKIVNFPAIDLADEQKKIAIQVTADPSGTKIRATIATFINKKLHSKYKRLKILLLQDPQKSYTFDKTNQKFIFKKTDIISLAHTIKDIQSLSPPQISKIRKFLDSQIKTNLFGNAGTASKNLLKLGKSIIKGINSTLIIKDSELVEFEHYCKLCTKNTRNINTLLRLIHKYNQLSRMPGEGETIRNFCYKHSLAQRVHNITAPEEWWP